MKDIQASESKKRPLLSETAHDRNNNTLSNIFSTMKSNSLGSNYEVVGFVPVRQQICSLIIINTDVTITEGTWEKVVNLSCDIEDIPHPA